MYHYTECGLDNVYLANGYKEIDTGYGKAYSVEKVQELHNVIGSHIIKAARPLTPQEFRFLRCELGFSQKCLADLLGVTELTISRWEKGTNAIKRPSEVLLRTLFKEKVDNNEGKISQLLEELASLDRQAGMERIVLERELQWREKAA